MSNEEYTHLRDGGQGSFFERNRTIIFIVVGVIALIVVLALVLALVIGLVVGLKHKDDDDDNGVNLYSKIQVKNIMGHLNELQAIAMNNNGTRAAITSGYNASVDYIFKQLESAGYKPKLHTFVIPSSRIIGTPTFSMVTPKTVTYRYQTDFFASQGSGSSPLNPTPAQVYQVPAYGCDASDFAAFPRGDVAVISRSPESATNTSNSCTLYVKASNAVNAGAVAAIIYNDGEIPSRMPVFQATLGQQVSIPVFTTSYLVGDHLFCSAQQTTVTFSITTQLVTVDTNNIIAQTTDHGDQNNVIAIGAHLDSVPAGPGINDDGSGSATILEIALQVAANGPEHFATENALRFCWWSGEELGLLGSIAYVKTLQANSSFEEFGDLSQIAAYLNFDMIGSPNYIRGVLNGSTAQNATEGCTRIQHLFEDDLEKYVGAEQFEPTTFGPPYRSDYGPFVTAGIPGGGLFTGAEVVKTPEQRSIYGGLAGVPFDPCYHLACDTTDNINQDVLKDFSESAARVMQKLGGMQHVREYLNFGNVSMTEQIVDWEHFEKRQTRAIHY